ncbi:MAG: hypothetical protein ABID38_00425, partial [Candidatus Diapherotrites archaeon]
QNNRRAAGGAWGGHNGHREHDACHLETTRKTPIPDPQNSHKLLADTFLQKLFKHYLPFFLGEMK